MTTVSEWLQYNDLSIFGDLLQDILGIPGNSDIAELSVISPNDISQFFDQIQQNYPHLNLSLKIKIEFKRRVLQLSKEMINQQQTSISQGGSSSTSSDSFTDDSAFIKYQSILPTADKDTLLNFENQAFKCNQKLTQDIPNLVKLNQNKYKLCFEKLNNIVKQMQTDILYQNVFKKSEEKLNNISQNYANMCQKIEQTKQQCVDQWNINMQQREQPGQELEARTSQRGRPPTESMLKMMHQVDILNSRYRSVQNQFNRSYDNAEQFLDNLYFLCQNFLETSAKDQEYTLDLTSQSQDTQDAQHAPNYAFPSQNMYESKQDISNDNTYDEEQTISMRSPKKPKYQKKQSGNHHHASSGYSRDHDRDRVHERVRERERDRDHHYGNTNRQSYATYGPTISTASNNGRAVFQTFNRKLVQTIVNHPNKNSKDAKIQRMIFGGTGSTSHVQRMVLSEIGFNRGVHTWTFMLNSKKHGCKNASQCKKTVPALQIGIMSLEMSNFLNVNNKPKFVNYEGQLHFFSPRSHDLGFGLRYYLSWNMHTNKMNLGTQGSNHPNLNFYVAVGDENDDHSDNNSNSKASKKKSNDIKWKFGDSITMELDCENWTLRFWRNNEPHYLGANIKSSQFQNGTIRLMRHLTYFPAISSLSCDCEGHGKGFVLDIF